MTAMPRINAGHFSSGVTPSDRERIQLQGTRFPLQRCWKITVTESKPMSTVLLIILILLILGAVPAWPHSRSWGYAPSGLLSVLLVVMIVLLLTGWV